MPAKANLLTQLPTNIPPYKKVDTSTEIRAALLQRIALFLPEIVEKTDESQRLDEGSAWFRLGDQLVGLDRPEAALAAFEQAFALDSRTRDHSNALVVVLAGLKRPQEALSVLRSLPRSADGLSMQSALYLDSGDAAASLESCDQALQLQATHFSALLNRGVALRTLGRLAEALTNDTRLVRAYIGSAVAHYNLGDALLAKGQYEQALQSLDRSLSIAPHNVAARMARAVALAMLQRFTESAAAFKAQGPADAVEVAAYLERAAQAVGLTKGSKPSSEPLTIYLTSTVMAQSRCDWRGRAALETRLREFAQQQTEHQFEPALAFNALVLDLSHEEQQAVARRVAAAALSKAKGWSVQPYVGGHQEKNPQRLRIGFLSPDYRQHPVADCHWRQFQLHDRERFEIIAYSLHPDDGSAVRRRIEKYCDQFIEVSKLSSQEIAERIASDGIHILVDLSGYTDHTRPEILAARPAPIQIQHMGAPGPSGAEYIDYRIADKMCIPLAEAELWFEKIAWLPDTLWLLNDTQVLLPPPTRTECGLPEDGFVFCCFNIHHKIDPAAFEIWMRLLRTLPTSVLWLASSDAMTQANLCSEAERRGVKAARLIFAPRLPLAEHLARHVCADLFLDCFNYNAGVTAAIAVRAGLPVLTCLGRTMAGRMGASLVQAAGLPELIASNHLEYETKALRYATRSDLLLEVREKLVSELSTAPLFQTEQRVREIERAYETMWARHTEGLPPASFEVARTRPI